MKKFLLYSAFLLLSIFQIYAQSKDLQINIIPQPTQIVQQNGSFEINNSTKILCDKKSFEIAEYLRDIIRPSTGFELPIGLIDKSDNAIILKIHKSNSSLGKEGYSMKVGKQKVTIVANENNGLFYGIQTLRQLLPPQIESKSEVKDVKWEVPCVEIKDMPKFVWRGLNLDCCRHFMSKDFVKRYIDLLAYHKMNILHWHLTEDQGWRIEIKKYPELTNKGAWRKYDDGSVYGGYYTQEDIKEVVKYAASRFITVVPEIEMPGHSTAAISCYPEISCTGGPFDVGTLWGIYYDVYCAGNEKTFQFLQDVIDEVAQLFPGKYIHIGGDEVPKDRWKNCPKCQARIKQENLKDENELQSYFIKRMEKYISAKGKKLIGWDEILEGGLPHEATVQSWRGINGAIVAAKQGHDVIVSPTSNCYFDYPVDITDLEKVYSFDPIPSELTSKEKKHVLGSEGNMWTEYAPQELVDDRLFPRILALAEVVWTYPKERNFDEFKQRVQKHYDRLDVLNVGYGLETKPFELNTDYDLNDHTFKVFINQLQKDLDLNLESDKIKAHKLDPSGENHFEVNSTDNLKIYLTRQGKKVGKTFNQGFTFNKATFKPVQLKYPYNDKYTAGGQNALTNGLRGSDSFRGGDKSWQGFLGTDFEATVDLGTEAEISKIGIGFFQASSSWVVFPEYIEYFVSDDGNNFEKMGQIDIPSTLRNPDWVQKDFTTTFADQKARYIKIFAKNLIELPSWHPSAGNKSWLMADEIIVE